MPKGGRSSSVMLQLSFELVCAADVTKLWLSLSVKQCQNHCSGSPPVFQDLSTHHDWPVKKAIVDLPIKMKGNFVASIGGPEPGYQRCFAVVTNRGTWRYICDTDYSELVHTIDQTEMIFLCRTQTNLANLTN